MAVASREPPIRATCVPLDLQESESPGLEDAHEAPIGIAGRRAGSSHPMACSS